MSKRDQISDCGLDKAVALASSKIDGYLEIAQELTRRAERLAREASAYLQTGARALVFRDNVLTGLTLKIDSAFRALIDDARARRAEAMHHLKTMAEAFIYYHAIAVDESAETAARVLAKAFTDKVDRLRGMGSHDEVAFYERAAANVLGGSKPLTLKLKRIAKGHSTALGIWYTQVYQLACEPAHLADLIDFMPDASTREFNVAAPRSAALRASVALYYGNHIMVAMFRDFNERNDAGLRVSVDDLAQRLDGEERLR